MSNTTCFELKIQCPPSQSCLQSVYLHRCLLNHAERFRPIFRQQILIGRHKTLCITWASQRWRGQTFKTKMASIAKRKRTLSIEEKSKRRKDAKTSYNLGRITIGSEVVRWRDFQRQHKFRSNEETARFLLDQWVAYEYEYE